MIRLAMPPGAYITMNMKTRPRYSSQALVNSDSSTSASTISTAPMIGPKKKLGAAEEGEQQEGARARRADDLGGDDLEVERRQAARDAGEEARRS